MARLSLQFAAAAILLGSGLSGALSQDEKIDCNQRTSIRPEAEICAQRAFDRTDARLNSTYRTAMKSQADLDRRSSQIDPSYGGAAAALKEAQRAWIAYRDKHCEGVSYQFAGGKMQGMLETECRTKLTRTRVTELQQLIKDTGN